MNSVDNLKRLKRLIEKNPACKDSVVDLVDLIETIIDDIDPDKLLKRVVTWEFQPLDRYKQGWSRDIISKSYLF